MTPENIRLIRGEHLENLVDYINGTRCKWDHSRGYSVEFARRHDEILEDIVQNPERRVRVIKGLDDICNCGFCPKMRRDCTSRALIQKDESVAAKYNVSFDGEYRSEILIGILVRGDTARKRLRLVNSIRKLFRKVGDVFA